MKLHEVLKIPQQPPSISLADFKLTTEKDTSVLIDNNPVITLESNASPNILLFSIKDRSRVLHNQYYVRLVAEKSHIAQHPTLYIYRTFVDQQDRNKGLMTQLYKALFEQLNYNLVSDVELSPESVAIWNKLRNTYEVKVLDLTNKKLYNISEISEEDLFDESLGYRMALMHDKGE